MDKKILKLTSPIPPSVNHYLAYRTVKKGNKYIAMSYKTTEAKKYQKDFIEYVKEEVLKQGWDKIDNRFIHIYMDCDFFFPRIDMDANNYFKILSDSITDAESVWLDDTQLCERVNTIRYDSNNPRIELTLYTVDYRGIFNDKHECSKFYEKCLQCSKNCQKCTVLKKALEGRIQPEINEEKECLKFKHKG